MSPATQTRIQTIGCAELCRLGPRDKPQSLPCYREHLSLSRYKNRMLLPSVIGTTVCVPVNLSAWTWHWICGWLFCYFAVTIPVCHKPRNSLKVCDAFFLLFFFCAFVLFSVVIVISGTSKLHLSNTLKLSLWKWCFGPYINLDKIQLSFTFINLRRNRSRNYLVIFFVA